MTYRVVWKLRELDRAGELYVRLRETGGDSAAVTAAMNLIDRLVSANPEQRGESRDKHERVLVVEPLTVAFEVHPDEGIVCVYRLHYFGP